jgi:hypothetical protein
VPLYQWQINGNNVGSNSTTFAPVSPANGSTVTLVMTSNFACASPATASSSAVVLTINPIPPQPSITPNGTVQLCSGASVTLTSSAAIGNNWSNGSLAQSIVVSAPGTYNVSQTQNGCTSTISANVTVSVTPTPIANLTPVNALCINDAPAVLQGNPPGGTFIGTAVNGNTFSPGIAGAGSFTVAYEIIGSNNCKGVSSITVTVMECTTLIESAGAQSVILIYPNPLHESNVQFQSGTQKITNVQLFDLTGRLIMQKELHSTTGFLNVADLPQGTYLIVTHTDKGAHRSKIRVEK